MQRIENEPQRASHVPSTLLEVGGGVLDAVLLAEPEADVDAVGVVRLQVVEDVVRCEAAKQPNVMLVRRLTK